VAARAEADLVGRRLSETQLALTHANARLAGQDKALRELEAASRAQESTQVASVRRVMAAQLESASGQLDATSLRLREAELALQDEKDRSASAQRDAEVASKRFAALLHEKELEVAEANSQARERLSTQQAMEAREVATLRLHMEAQQQVFDERAEAASAQLRELSLQLSEEKERVVAAGASGAELAGRFDRLVFELDAAKRLVRSHEDTIRDLDARAHEARAMQAAAHEADFSLLQVEAELREAKRYVEQLHREKDDMAVALRRALHPEAPLFRPGDSDPEAAHMKAAYRLYLRDTLEHVSHGNAYARPVLGRRGSAEYLAVAETAAAKPSGALVKPAGVSRSCLDMWE
jgi:hypothetical protein